MTKEANRSSKKFPLTDWARKNFRFIGELQSLGLHNEAHHLKYNPVSRDDVRQLFDPNNPGLANLIESMPVMSS